MSQQEQERLILSSEELNIIGHTLGVNVYHALKSKKKKDKQLPKEYYRNYFCASVNCNDFPILNGLQLKGIMQNWTKFNNIYFGVTDEGKEIFKKEYLLAIDSTK